MKKNTPYEVSLASRVCIYCGAVFTSTKRYENKRYFTLSAQKQLEGHYVGAHRKVENDVR